MKKYVKPELIYERYELAQHIAACMFDLNHANETACGFKGDESFGFGGLFPFAEEGKCEDTNVEGYCYQANGTEGLTLFNS